MISRKGEGPIMEPWGTPALTGILAKTSNLELREAVFTEKRWNMVKYPTWNSIRIEFVEKNSMPKPATLHKLKIH